MLRVKIGASLALLFYCLQPMSYSQTEMGQAIQAKYISGDPMVDVHGNLLFFKKVASKTDGVGTEVTLVSPSARAITHTYPGILSPIRRGEKGFYAIQRVPAASAGTQNGPATVSLVALVTGPGSLPSALVDYSLGVRPGLFKIASGLLTGSAADLIYVGQHSSAGRSVLVLTFDGTAFKPVSGSPVVLP
jgi:hypothetical protein